jgi:hypothetical protein
VYEIDSQPEPFAFATTSSGVIASPGIAPGSFRGHCDICQFWQKPHWKLHPTVAIEYALEPGRK